MYYKAFVLLRLPVSVHCLCGFGLLNVLQEPGMGFFGFVVVVGLLVFSAVTTRRLVRRRRGAFRMASSAGCGAATRQRDGIAHGISLGAIPRSVVL